ncbi:dirigent protein 1 [Sorghum bicolor]|uniref:Dirigent protein n=1 Tax=Sorghum bicolor TaxID=4558 RepID=C5WMC9_SORBI|nr:dirigent protein 1 [Sorghum bicolor]EER91665.1 hypothetical protein SORBI_3001G256800 [Sorghum bicolor]|eukprot:XP_002464667.1 dirigent protein 1 [Sorghum bicolor]
MAPCHCAMLPLFCSLVFSMAAAVVGETGGDVGRPTHLHFYFHENFSGGPNGTTVVVSKVRGGSNNSSFFGGVFVVDDMLREGPDPASQLLGRAQGLTVGTSLSDGALLTVLNFVFTEGAYSGSSLTLLGRALLGTVMERPIVGGTGVFRMARGYTLSKMVQSPDPNNLLVLEYDAYIWH